ncbi:hypothetical protein SAMD00019534_070510, partial [Acytostelium subglobosum LB1]|uniref:hypothetical protein n=1 Tax=Acytostelium subglobosum LB1 TaxID=1410327 RepID=UPI00064523B0
INQSIKSIMSGTLVIGGTGLCGKEVVNALIKQGVTGIKVATRDAAKAGTHSCPASASYVSFDYAKPETFDAALENVSKVFVICLPMDAKPAVTIAKFVEALKARSSTITRVVMLSSQCSEKLTLVDAELLIQNSGLANVVIRPTFFLDDFTTFIKGQVMSGTIYTPVGDAKMAWLAAADIGQCAATLLSNDAVFTKYQSKSIALCGTKAVSMPELCALLSQHIGRTITAVSPSLADFEQTLLSYGTPADSAAYMVQLYRCIAAGDADIVTSDMSDINGRPSVSAEQFIINNLSHWK